MLELAANDPAFAVVLLIALAALLTAAVTGYAWWRGRVASNARAEDLRRWAALQARLETTEAVLNTDPDALFLWPSKHHVQLFGGQNLMIGNSKEPFSEFNALLNEASRDKLQAAMAQLYATGQRFAFPLLCNDARTFAVTGKPAGPGVALWVSDVTEAFQEISTLRDALRDTMDEYRMLREAVDLSPFAVWRRDAGGKLVWVNQAYCKAVGNISREAVIAQNENLIDQGALAQVEIIGAAQRVSTVVNGSRRVLDVYRTLESQYGYGLALDFTDLDEAQRELRRQIDAQYETINLLHTPIAIFSAGKELEFSNLAYAELWGLETDFLASAPSHGEVLEAMRSGGRLPEQADFPAWKRKRLSQYNELIETQEELWHLADGRTLRVVTQPRPQGGLLILYEDLTAMLTLERSFNALTRVQNESLNGLQEGVAVFGIDGRLSLFNPASLRIWGMAPVLLENRPHINQLAEMVRQQTLNQEIFSEVVAQVTDRETVRTANSIRIERNDGSVLDCDILPLPDGGTMLTFSDVTDSVQIERALRDRNEALEAADRLKSEFVSHISYHLRTPLNSIIGFGEILEQEFFGPLNPRQHEYSAGLLVASHQLLTLINDIIDIATIEAGNMQLDRAPANVFAMLTAVADLARNLVHESGVGLRIDCPRQHSVIQADSRRIKQVMFNLLSNAVRFSNPGDEVTIGANHITGKDGEEICQLWVRDTGTGIDGDFQQNMFDTFKSRARKGRDQGAGIGLALVRRLIELHGGWVEVNSQPGTGTVVTCNLPQVTATRSAQPAASIPKHDAA